MKSVKIFSYITALCAILSIVAHLSSNKRLSYFPIHEGISHYLCSDSSDPTDPGNSTISELRILPDSSIQYSFILGDSSRSPYAAIDIYQENLGTLDISDYDIIQIRFGKDSPLHYVFDLRTIVEGYTDIPNEFTLRYCSAEVKRKRQQKTISLPLNELVTPDWWYSENGVTPEQFDEYPDWSKTYSVIIYSSIFNSREVPYVVTIEDITFVQSRKKFYISLSLLLISLLLLLHRVWLFKRQKKPAPNIHYRPLSIEDEASEEMKNILNYIGEHYSDTDFTVDMLCEFSGLSQRKISSLFRETQGETVKQYLNSIRLEEAKRLILNTDRRVTDIAYSVGYNYPSHFNKLFQNRFGMTPSQMRKSL